MSWSYRFASSLAVLAIFVFVAACGGEEITGNDHNDANDSTPNGNQQNDANQNGEEDWDEGFTDVANIIQQGCALDGCHGETPGTGSELGFGGNQEDVSLETIQSIFEDHEVDGRGPLVEPGDAAASELYVVLVSDDIDIMMPQGANPLPDAQIDTVRDWIDNGANYK